METYYVHHEIHAAGVKRVAEGQQIFWSAKVGIELCASSVCQYASDNANARLHTVNIRCPIACNDLSRRIASQQPPERTMICLLTSQSLDIRDHRRDPYYVSSRRTADERTL